MNELGPEYRADKYSAKDRDAMAKSGAAMANGSYPIKDAEDLANAIHLAGMGKDSTAAVKAHIIARAKALGLTSKLPPAWVSGSKRRARYNSEHRHRAVLLTPHSMELRSGEPDDDGKVVLRGTVIKYGVPYTVRDKYGEFEETIERGAARDLLASNPDVRFLFDHSGIPLARSTVPGSLSLRDTDDGVEVEARLNPEMPSAKDVIEAVKDGLVSQMSVGMVVGSDHWDDGMTQRSVQRLSGMPDVSAVTYPASPTTNLALVQRAALGLTAEQRAQLGEVSSNVRLDHLAAEIRAGRTLSAANAAKLVTMAQTAHDLLASSGDDFDHEAHPYNHEDFDGDGDEPTVTYMDDGSENDGSETDPDLDDRSQHIELELRQLQAEQELAEVLTD